MQAWKEETIETDNMGELQKVYVQQNSWFQKSVYVAFIYLKF